MHQKTLRHDPTNLFKVLKHLLPRVLRLDLLRRAISGSHFTALLHRARKNAVVIVHIQRLLRCCAAKLILVSIAYNMSWVTGLVALKADVW